jgi:hypothetical protein
MDMTAAAEALAALYAAKTAKAASAGQAALDNAQAPAPDDMDENLTSLQALGMTEVMVCYSSDGGLSLSIDGAMVNGEYVEIDEFSEATRFRWFRAIRDEERRDQIMAGWNA